MRFPEKKNKASEIQDAKSVSALLVRYSMENNAAFQRFLERGSYLNDPSIHSEIKADFDSINEVIAIIEQEIMQGRIPTPEKLLDLHGWIQITIQKANNEFGKAQKTATIN